MNKRSSLLIVNIIKKMLAQYYCVSVVGGLNLRKIIANFRYFFRFHSQFLSFQFCSVTMTPTWTSVVLLSLRYVIVVNKISKSWADNFGHLLICCSDGMYKKRNPLGNLRLWFSLPTTPQVYVYSCSFLWLISRLL